MTHNADLPPLPWRESERVGMAFLTEILDAGGARVATIWGRPEQRRAVTDLLIGASRDVASNRRIGGGGLYP